MSHPNASPHLGTFNLSSHISYFTHYLFNLPQPYQGQDNIRLTLLYFALSALDLLGELEELLNQNKHLKNNIINYVYSLQVISKDNNHTSRNGFRGSSNAGIQWTHVAHDNDENIRGSEIVHSYDEANLAQTYSALAILLILGDDLSRVNKGGIISSLKSLQRGNGSFSSSYLSGESDMRFIYCAAVISYMLNDVSGFDFELSASYISRCQSYEGGIGLNEFTESHGGSTYTAVAALTIIIKQMNQHNNSNKQLSDYLNVNSLLKWCLNRQGSGFSGRTNKAQDCCYSFWLGATITILGYNHYLNKPNNIHFNLQCQHSKLGGFAKEPNAFPDILHSYFGLCGLQLNNYTINNNGIDKRINDLDPLLGLSRRAAAARSIYPDSIGTFRIRAMRREDNEALAAVIRGVLGEYDAVGPGYFTSDPNFNNLFAIFNAEGSVYYIVEDNEGNVVGGAGFTPLHHLTPAEQGKACDLRGMYLNKSARGLGVGKLLLSKLIQAATLFKYSSVYADTLTRMTSAIKLYESNGFKPVQQGCAQYSACDLFYVKHLKS
jgi:geranylgeranyl transferase type-1 subunit beta